MCDYYSSFSTNQSGVKGDASPLQVKGSALVAVRRNLRAEARLNDKKALKGCGEKQEFFPTSHISSYKHLSSETVRWTVSEASGVDFFDNRIGAVNSPDSFNIHFRL